MNSCWRIVRKKHAATAFSGEGAARSGGRWNSRGVPVVYASSAQSLAALETLVHLNPPMPLKYVVFRIRFNRRLLEKVSIVDLPSDWRAEPPAATSKAIGDAWVWEARSAVIELPSAIIPEESNYLFNPAHPDFKKLLIGKPERFAFDPRLLK